MEIEKQLDLITRNTDEVLTIEDLRNFLEQGIKLNHYIGFEISGRVHLGTGLMTGIKIADFQKAKVNCTCYLATWHAWINNKLDGTLETIRKASKYFAAALKASIAAMGGDEEKVNFVAGDELYHNNDLYWKLTIEIAKHTTLSRAIRSTGIMGRIAEKEMPLAWVFYPAMQVADIFILDANLAHAGMDQRKAHVIARDVATKITTKPLLYEGKAYKPVAVHHHMLLGLQKPPIWPFPKEKLSELWAQVKMSKSIGKSSIFVDDSPEEIKEKVYSAFCFEGEVDFNPLLDWAKHLIFIDDKSELTVERKFAPPITFYRFEDLKNAFAKKEVHPLDLKNAMASKLIEILEPVRKRLKKPSILKLRKEIEEILFKKEGK